MDNTDCSYQCPEAEDLCGIYNLIWKSTVTLHVYKYYWDGSNFGIISMFNVTSIPNLLPCNIIFTSL